MGAAPQMNADTSAKLTTERISEGEITCIRFAGVIDESFEGKRLGSTVKTPILILDMGRVQKVSSFGIREWSEFIKLVERSAENIYVVECPPKVVDQINMVANFLGGARILSFYAPYRCDYCDVDNDVLFQVDRDGAAIRSYDPPERLCETCARPQYFDEDPATFFSSVATQAQFDLAGGVSEFLTTRLQYSLQGGNRRLQIDKHVEGSYTYLKLSGNLDGSFPSEKLAEGLEGSVVIDVALLGNVDIAGAAEWRNFVTLARQGADRIYVFDCPPILLERVPSPEDLGDEVVSFSMPYTCSACSTTTSQLIDVEEHFEILRFATPPEMRCSNCKEATTCAAQESLLSRLRSLPKPQVDAKLKNFVKTARKRKVEKQVEAVQQASVSNRRVLGLVALAMTGVLGATGFVVYYYTNKADEYGVRQRETQTKLDEAIRQISEKASEQRPAWVTQDSPFAGYCTNQVSRISCVGVSSYLPTEEEATDEARIVALEELAVSVAVNIESEVFDERVRSLYADARFDALSKFENVRNDVKNPTYAAAYQRVRDARRRVTQALLASAKESIPLQHADRYWEKYAKDDGGFEYLVYIRFDIDTDKIRSLIDLYSKPRDIDGGKALTGFPLLAWSYPDFEGGAVIIDNHGALAAANASSVVVASGGQPVHTADELAAAVKEGHTDFAVAKLAPLQ